MHAQGVPTEKAIPRVGAPAGLRVGAQCRLSRHGTLVTCRGVRCEAFLEEERLCAAKEAERGRLRHEEVVDGDPFYIVIGRSSHGS